jgi:hypothetical protein
LNSPYIGSRRIQQKALFPCYRSTIPRLSLVYSLQREPVYRVVAYQRTYTSAPLLLLSGVMLQYTQDIFFRSPKYF